jgi:hypothetical protein
MSDTWVLSFTHLKDKPQATNAQRQLQRIASLVKPIMRKHHWKLPVLSEFFPDDPRLLGECDRSCALDMLISIYASRSELVSSGFAGLYCSTWISRRQWRAEDPHPTEAGARA